MNSVCQNLNIGLMKGEFAGCVGRTPVNWPNKDFHLKVESFLAVCVKKEHKLNLVSLLFKAAALR